jgi:hypothetical protein
MSLTEAEELFGGIHESALNDFVTAFFTARPRHLHYGSPVFVTATTPTETEIPPIAFPGVPGGIHWAVDFDIPVIDFFDDDSGGTMPPEMSLTEGRLTLRTKVRLRLLCGSLRDLGQEEPPRDDDKVNDRKPDDRRPGGAPHVVATDFEVWALCRPVTRPAGTPNQLSIRVDRVELVDIGPDTLESLLECLILLLLRGALAGMWLPIPALRAGAFSATITRGPEIEDDQAKLYGTTP